MASYTPNLNLYKKDPIADGNDFFNIKTMMNDNWDKIDEKVKDALDDIGDLQSEQVRIATGSYVGTGTYGASNPCSLTFPFVPKIVLLPFNYYSSFVWGDDKSATIHENVVGGGGSYAPILVNMDMVPTSYKTAYPSYSIETGNTKECYVKKTSDGKSLQWYSPDQASYQGNTSGVIYHYAFFG